MARQGEYILSKDMEKSNKISLLDLINLKNDINDMIKQKIIYDITNSNDVIKCLLPIDKKYKDIFLTNNQYNKVLKVFPNLINKFKDEKTYWYVCGCFENLINQRLIELLNCENIENFKIVTIPKYINNYRLLIKYYDFFEQKIE